MKAKSILINQYTRFISLSLAIIFLVALLSGSLQIKARIPGDASVDEFKSHMVARIPALMKQYSVPGCSIALVVESGIVWTEAFGYADIENGRRLTVNTPMSVQSITKPVTAWGVLRLVQEGLIGLDDPVSKHLNSWKFIDSTISSEKITIRQLLSHTAGMPLGDFTDIYAPGEAIPSIRDAMTREAVPVREPGTGFSYSNTGFNLLEIMIEDVTGQAFSEYIISHILLPLGLETATFDINGSMDPYPPTGYNLKGEAVPVYLYPAKASGGLFATVLDIAAFAVAGLKENPVLNADSIEMMYQAESQDMGMYSLVFDAYGLGHYLETLPNGLHSISHGGQGNGIMTHFQTVQETGDAIVILTNSQRSWPLIATVLREWTQWRDFSSVGMEKILLGQYVLCAVSGILISACLLVISRMKIAYKDKEIRNRLLQLFTAVFLIAILVLCASREYLFLSAVFPVMSMWLGAAVFALAAALLVSAAISGSSKTS